MAQRAYSTGSAWPTVLCLLTQVPACSPEREEPTVADVSVEPVGAPAVNVRFVDVTSVSGLDFLHVSGDSQQRYILESMSGGAVFLDFDGDDYLDLYLVNGTRFETNPDPPISRLYHNAEGARQGDRAFVDVTERAGVGGSGWGMGATSADYDNDGDVDLYVTRWGANQLYRNDGDGGFRDVSSSAGVDDDGWGSSAAFADLDADGWVDLYVANYVEFDLQQRRDESGCQVYGGVEGFCGPVGWPARADVLYRNRGDGGFDDLSAATGIGDWKLPGLGVAFCDYDDDGDQDIYVANDKEANQLWRNDGDWHFTEAGVAAGVAYSIDGTAQAGMGVDFGDFDNDGDFDLYVTNFSGDVNTLYENEGGGMFVDATAAAGLDGAVRPLLGWSTSFLDADGDGWQDLFVANGHLYPQLESRQTSLGYAQPNLFYWNRGGAFALAGAEVGDGLRVAKVSRGAAFGDYDNDGDVDVVVVNLNDRPTLLRNEGGNDNGWLGLDLEGSGSNRNAVGARVRVTIDGNTQSQEVQRGYGYQSGHDGRLLFGLGNAAVADRVEIRWPSGRVQSFESLKARQYHKIGEGGTAPVSEYAAETRPSMVPPTPPPLVSTSASDKRQGGLAEDLSAAELYLRGSELHEGARYEEAVSAFRAAVEKAPEFVEAHYALAVSLFEGLGRRREALSASERAAKLDSVTAPILHLLGAIRMSVGQPDEAITALEQAASLAPRDWEIRQTMGMVHLGAGDLQSAAAAFELAATLAPYAPTPHAHLAHLFSRLGQPEAARRERRQFDRWRPVQDRITLYEKALESAPNDAELHFVTGQQYLLQGRGAEAEAAFARAVALKSEFANARIGLAGALHSQGKLDRAIAEYGFAYVADASLVTALVDMGIALRQSGSLGQAIATFEKVVELSPDLARGHLHLGAAYAEDGREEQAQAALQKAAELDRSLDEEREHGGPAMGEPPWLSSLQEVERGGLDDRGAEELYKRALTSWSIAVGKDHLYVLANLNSLGKLYQTWGRHRDAETLHKHALKIRQKVFGERHPQVALSLSNLASLYRTLGRTGEAEMSYRRALSIREQGLGSEHPQVADSQSELGRLYLAQGRVAEAESLFERALEIREKGVGDRHPEVAMALYNLGWLKVEQGFAGAAEPLLKRALRIWENVLGPAHANVATALDLLGQLYSERRREAEAEAAHRRALDIRRSTLGSEHVHVALTLSSLARLLHEQGRHNEAEPLYVEALVIWKRKQASHPEVEVTRSDYTRLLRETGRTAEAEESKSGDEETR